MAQFILESGYGKSELVQGANNCFGMKKSLSGNTWSGSAWDGVSIYTKKTQEQKADGSYATSLTYNKYYDGMYIPFKTGMRISEFTGLTVKDLDMENRTINIDHQLQKTGTLIYIDTTKTYTGTRVIPMQDDVYECFQQITPNVCRHTYCSNMAKSGMNPKVLQYLMGHSDISITLNTYTHLKLDDAREYVEKLAKKQAEAENEFRQLGMKEDKFKFKKMG